MQTTSKSDDQQCLALFLHLLHERTQVLATFQHYHVTQHLVMYNSVGNKTKSIRLRPRPKTQNQDQDRGRSQTGLVIIPRSQIPRLPKTATSHKYCFRCYCCQCITCCYGVSINDDDDDKPLQDAQSLWQRNNALLQPAENTAT